MVVDTKTETVNVLLVDDEQVDCRLVKLALANSSESIHFNVETVDTLSEATERLSRNDYDIVLLDLGLPDSSGMDTLEEAHKVNPDVPMIVLTGLSDEEMGIEAIKRGAEDYLIKGKSFEFALCRIVRYTIERKRAAQKQVKLIKELERANKELKDFVSIVSHDLKAPLRGIKSLANWVVADYADKISDDGKEQMNLLLTSVERMHNLIDGVLRYSKVGRIEEKQIQINLNKFVPELIDMIGPPENIAITVENELPVIECAETHIMQLFQNLLSNAIKYIDKPQGQIRIGCVEENGFWKFSVADNGPGIEEKHFEKIFRIFQRLSPHDEPESTGVGLTVVKKIVELYGGMIWVESKPGEGSTFLFTLLKQEEPVKDAKLEASIAI